MQAAKLVSIGAVADELKVSPARVRALTAAGVLHATRSAGGHRRYDLDTARRDWRAYLQSTPDVPGRRLQVAAELEAHLPLRSEQAPAVVDLTVALDGLHEDQVWQQIEPALGLHPDWKARPIAQYSFTEMLNNAIDHSGGTTARVQAWRTDERIAIEILDDGVGALRRLADGKGLPSPIDALAELTKGKQTTAPDRHTGEGIFFTSKAVAVFRLEANLIVWIVDNERNDFAVGSSELDTGTKVRLEIDVNTDLDLGALFGEFTIDYDFKRTRPVVKLFEIGVTFVSRSEAKRLMTGMEEFEEVELNFAGVQSVGQGFVDEVFRVWPSQHTGTRVLPTHMNPGVTFMVERARHQE